MKVIKINVNGQEFLNIELIAVNQKGSRFYVGIIPAEDFLKIFTVKPTRYNSETEAAIAATFADDKEYLEHRISTKRERAENIINLTGFGAHTNSCRSLMKSSIFYLP